MIIILLRQSARSKVDQSTHLLVQTICEHFRHNRFMRQKIFNSNESAIMRIMRDYDKFNRRYWWLRSSSVRSFYNWRDTRFFVGYVDFHGALDYGRPCYNYGALPICAI